MMRTLFLIATIVFFMAPLIGQEKLEVTGNATDGLGRNIALFENTANGNRAINIINFAVGSGNTTTTSNLAIFHTAYTGSPNVAGFTGLTNEQSGVYLRAPNAFSKHRFFIGGTALVDSKMTINNIGVGMGTDDPKGALDVAAGNFFIRNTATPILQDPSGGCWQLAVSTTGALSTTSITCP